ncbi:MAG: hypothetical protein H6Q69_4983 [Firmicutes bacterium]|nr:hypothetical protein [Bacillota bacterium]
MEQQYLLTFDIFIKELDKIIPSYAWFEHEEDMNEFIHTSPKITVIDKLKINQCEMLK